ncbi:MAG TPA: tetratricopeptide repeat protein, partial [Longimicrobium sp.]|nr:tetratricopeptide repeat protein [Longimicrobium sp.]
VRLARNRDWHTYALAYLSLGTLYMQLGNLPAAETLTSRALRTARRRNLRALEGAAYHNLFVLAAERGEYGQAQDYAGRALSRYGKHHPRVPYLAYDLGCVWFLCGRFHEAFPVLRAVLPHIPDTVERPMLLANVARAAAGAGNRQAFHQYWTQSVEAAAAHGEHAAIAQAWLNLARGAISVQEPGLAEVAALQAGAIADRLRMGQIRIEAESVLHCARTGGLLPQITDSRERNELARRTAEMAHRMISALEPLGATG